MAKGRDGRPSRPCLQRRIPEIRSSTSRPADSAVGNGHVLGRSPVRLPRSRRALCPLATNLGPGRRGLVESSPNPGHLLRDLGRSRRRLLTPRSRLGSAGKRVDRVRDDLRRSGGLACSLEAHLRSARGIPGDLQTSFRGSRQSLPCSPRTPRQPRRHLRNARRDSRKRRQPILNRTGSPGRRRRGFRHVPRRLSRRQTWVRR
jgi:hypothetical protein